MNYAEISRLGQLIQKCRASSLPVFRTVIGYLYQRSQGRNLLCAPRTRIKGADNIIVDGFAQIGMDNVGFMHHSDDSYLCVRGALRLKGKVNIGRGSRFDIGIGASCEIERCFINARCLFVIMHQLTIKTGCVVSWDCMFLDEDFHQLDYPGRKTKEMGIVLERNVWVGARATLLQGTRIPVGSVVAANAVVSGPFSGERLLIAGNPARVVRTGIEWR